MTKPFFEGYASSPSSSTNRAKTKLTAEQIREAMLEAVKPALDTMLVNLQQQLNDSDCRLWTTSQTAKYLGISKSTLEKKRSMYPEISPPCKMIFGSCKYDPLEIEAWLHVTNADMTNVKGDQ
jgi:hypothetical protein